MMRADFRGLLSSGVLIAQAMIFGTGCNERTPILDTAAVPTSPSATMPPAPLPPDGISRIALYPPGNVGGSTGRGTVYLDVPARNGGRMVTLQSADASLVSVPSQVLVPEGALSADFSFTTRTVPRNVNVTLTASSGERTLSEYLSVWTAATSFLAYTADPGILAGELVVRRSSDGTGRPNAYCNFNGGGLVANDGGGASFTMFISGPHGVRIGPGVYHDANNTDAIGNYLHVSGTRCQTAGRVEIQDINMDARGNATRLRLEFELTCINSPGSVRGIFRLVTPGPDTPTLCAQGLRPGPP